MIIKAFKTAKLSDVMAKLFEVPDMTVDYGKPFVFSDVIELRLYIAHRNEKSPHIHK